MKISENCVVSINYTLEDDNGNLLDKSEEQPLAYIHGTGSLISGLEKELEGKTSGDNIKVVVEPKDAYGEYRPQLIQTVSKEMFQGVEKVEPGMQFEARGADNETMVVRVDEVEGNNVTINGNHPLAGVALNFDVEVVDVREASDEELEHGHVHG